MKSAFTYKVILMASVGFAAGMFIGILITASSVTAAVNDGSLYLCAPEFISFMGKPLAAFAVQALLSGVLGAVGMGGAAVYSIDEWSVLKATVTHFIPTVIVYFLVAGFLRWFDLKNITEWILMLSIFISMYLMIWLMQYLSLKLQISEINRELQEYKAAGSE